jgi:hypothetical protein
MACRMRILSSNDVLLGWTALLEVLQLMFLVHKDKDVAVEGLRQAGATNLVGLKDDVNV